MSLKIGLKVVDLANMNLGYTNVSMIEKDIPKNAKRDLVIH